MTPPPQQRFDGLAVCAMDGLVCHGLPQISIGVAALTLLVQDWATSHHQTRSAAQQYTIRTPSEKRLAPYQSATQPHLVRASSGKGLASPRSAGQQHPLEASKKRMIQPWSSVQECLINTSSEKRPRLSQRAARQRPLEISSKIYSTPSRRAAQECLPEASKKRSTSMDASGKLVQKQKKYKLIEGRRGAVTMVAKVSPSKLVRREGRATVGGGIRQPQSTESANPLIGFSAALKKVRAPLFSLPK